jgi:hypothetical protein
MLVHHHAGEPLKEVKHAIPLAVLEQENFAAQGIDTSALVAGAPKVDALGNCVLNAGTAAVSFLGPETYSAYLAKLLPSSPSPAQYGGSVALFADAKTGEEAAIVAYHGCTDQTHNSQTEWPPTDCGSSGVYLVEYLKALGIVSSQKVAHGAQNIASLLQTGPVLNGGPFFNSWEEPGPLGMIDGNGTASDLEAAIRSGVAGGHERLSFEIEKLVISATGKVEPEKTVLVDRNSWGKSWGDDGCYRVHLSTYVALGQYMDFRELVA